jgi:hypothetical protein
MFAFHRHHQIWIVEIFNIKTSGYYHPTLIISMVRIKMVLGVKAND